MANLPWRRSPIWLVLRVAPQSSLFEGVDHADYKHRTTDGSVSRRGADRRDSGCTKRVTPVWQKQKYTEEPTSKHAY
ncbi:uncharacterized protein BT62DRAFT_936881 [Guyanagaster necrorhizus]|uniref:DUF6606 domain-containing protein n=1 Tax=Guyanagaster necrorhizus TaxID=856835 RepID=A0A9P8ANB1_9AGAR|nr:uncharacterized protein BT62DRAFT_936881 [Guyanagaster necrorhizus MCA 3950]KAG7441576.1 hypothetical protein BT62DRAFT_936881 [Guyanagaster necrorhizus MCA 3950]